MAKSLSSDRIPSNAPWMCLLLLLALIVVISAYLGWVSYMTESFRQSEAHMFAHFGGVPNNSQIWPNMVKYPKQYV